MYIHIIVFIGIVGLNIIILGLVIYWYRNKMLSQYNSFLNKADEILGGKQIDMRYDESLDSAISERLNRIVEISNMQKEVAEHEHNTIKSLLSNISHQIRTPLANITLYAGLLKEEVNESTSFRLADKIEKNAEKLEFFMKELLKSSYSEQEIISVNPKIIELDKIGLSYWDTVSLRQQRIQGIDYDIELTEPRDDQVSTIRKMDSVKYAGLNVKCGIVSKYQDKELDKLKLYWLDDTCWKQQTIPALDYYKGSYPTKENEIMLSQSALRSIGIKKPKVGMELPFIYQTLAENSENNDTAKTFILSGWFLDYTGVDKGYVSDKFYQSTGVLQTDLTEGTLKISLKNPLYSEKDIIEMQNQINLSGKQIIKADYDTISNFINTMIGLLVLLVLVFMSGYLFIYNTLYISVNRDIRYFGQLKTIGTTSIQIRKMIYKQMLWNSTMGIPLGLVCSAIVGKIIIPQLLHSLNPTIAPSEVGTISLGVFIIATIFSLATTMISSQKPVKIAMNCSPIEAMKYIGATSIKNKNKKRTGGNILSMVKMNLFRDKKQFVVIMCSLSLAVSLFLIINVVIYANNAKNILNHSYDYDIRLLNQTSVLFTLIQIHSMS